MGCTPDQKVRYVTHMLAVEADDWWLETHRRLEANGNKYVVEYAAEFGELAKFDQYYEGPNGELSKCIKFENGLRLEIKKAVSYQKICIFPDLVDSCRIYKEDNNAHYRVINEKRSKSQQGRGKPYEASNGKGKQKVSDGEKTSGGDAPAGIVCFKCGKVGNKSTSCNVDARRCYGCGKFGHALSECTYKDMSVRFYSPKEEGVKLLSSRQMRVLMKEDVQVFSLVASMSVENQTIIEELKVVCEFPEVFPDEIPDVPPEREVDFSIDLVPEAVVRIAREDICET
ncbi:uncharacterized protein LOC131621490 [Vicia villosa]|uniref:uncharacterized protein LOC131621490 n=1 Tax=Vicia villosa TaxID=3911 RepID=UPI00273BA762|nr:uncharacterized protein LOC131621490 [Vicia villosa]